MLLCLLAVQPELSLRAGVLVNRRLEIHDLGAGHTDEPSEQRNECHTGDEEARHRERRVGFEDCRIASGHVVAVDPADVAEDVVEVLSRYRAVALGVAAGEMTRVDGVVKVVGYLNVQDNPNYGDCQRYQAVQYPCYSEPQAYPVICTS